MVGVGLVVVLVIVAMVLASVSARRVGPPYDPTSTEPDGAAALIELLRRFDTEVNMRNGMPGDEDRLAVVLQSPIAPSDEDAILQFVRDGNVVVVADPFSSLLSGLGLDGAEAVVPFTEALDRDVPRGDCTLALDGVNRLRGFSATLPAPPDAGSCFGTGGRAGLVVRQVGDGTVIAVAGPDPFSNAYLAQADNAVLAITLLSGQGPVAFIQPGGSGDGGYGMGRLVGLLPQWFWRLMAGLAVAAALSVWASARRLGRPVYEPALLDLPAVGLTEGVANLWQRARRPASAAYWLRVRAHRQLAQRVGLAASASSEEVARALAAARHDVGLDPMTEAIKDLLVSGSVTDGATLVGLSDGLDTLRGRGHDHADNANTAATAAGPASAQPDREPRSQSPQSPQSPQQHQPSRRHRLRRPRSTDSPTSEVPYGST